MAKKVTDAFEEQKVASFTADIVSVSGDDVKLQVKSVASFNGFEVSLKEPFTTVSREKDFMRQYPQGSVGSHVEGVVTTDFTSENYGFKHIVCPV